jgi:quinol monooxygenase YgiN
MIAFVTHLEARPENEAALEALIAHVREQTLRHEPGVACYEFGRSVEEPGRWAVIEVYRDAEAHAAHMATDWVRESIPRSRRLVEGGFDIRQYVGPGATPAVRRMTEI